MANPNPTKPAVRGKCRTGIVAVVADKKAKALDLRLKGLGYRQIAKQLGISLGSAYELVADGIAELQQQTVEKATEVRQLETDRLDLMLAALAPQLKKGCTKAIGAALRIQERRAKLWGLDVQAEESSLEKALTQFLTQSTTQDTTAEVDDEE